MSFDVTATAEQVYTMWTTPAYHGAVTEALASIVAKKDGDIRLWSGAVSGHFIELIPNFYLKNNMNRTGIAGIFAASLELTKEGLLSISQKKIFDKLMVKKTQNE